MKKIKILFLFLVCSTLLSCPSHHIYDYVYSGQNSKKKANGFERLTLNHNSEILIDCFFYYSFIGEKDKVLVAKFAIEKNTKVDLHNLKVKVESVNFGEMEQMELPNLPIWDSLETKIYGRKIDMKNENKIREILKNDTIKISFDNGIKYSFVRKAE